MKMLSPLLAFLCASPLLAQSNAESELIATGDIIGQSITVSVDGVVPNATTYLLPSFDLNGSNYLVGISGDANDFLTIGTSLAQNGTYFTTPADGNGRADFSVTIPNNPAYLDLDVYLQAFSASSATTFEKFSNTVTISMNNADRWQRLTNAPIASANLGFAVEDLDFNGNVRTAFICGGGPYLLTDEFTPYPTIDRAWRYDSAKEEFTLLDGRMNESRAFHNTLRLQDGRMMVVGGIQGPFGSGPYHVEVLNDAEIYDPATDTWTTTAPMSQYRAGSTANLLPDGRVLVAGGTRGDGQNRLFSVDDLLTTALRTTEIYDPATDSWSAGPNMSEPKAGAVSVALDNGEIMIAGGVTFESIFGIPIPDFSDRVVFYDPASNSFRSKTMREKRALFGMVKMNNGSVLLAGGAGGDIFSIGPIKKCEVYDPVADNFTNTPLLSVDVAFSGCVALPNGNAVVIGGATGDLDDPIPVVNCWEFDPNSNSFTALPDMIFQHGGHVSLVTGSGTVTVIGGESNSGTSEAKTETYSF